MQEKQSTQTERGIFYIKLCELENQCCNMQKKINQYQLEDQHFIQEEIQQLIQQCQEADRLLEQRATKSHSPIAVKIATAQQKYNQEIKQILKWDIFKQGYVEKKDVSEEQAETMALYAEYAVDFSLQAMQRTLLAMLYAIDLQFSMQKKD